MNLNTPKSASVSFVTEQQKKANPLNDWQYIAEQNIELSFVDLLFWERKTDLF